MTVIILLGMAMLAYALAEAPKRTRPAWSQHLKGWQRLFGVAAFIVALLIVLNPEFLALGLLGDAAFFDALVLLLSLQLQMVGARAWHCVRTALSGTIRWAGIPSLGMCYLLAVSALAIENVVSTIRKVLHQLSS